MKKEIKIVFFLVIMCSVFIIGIEQYLKENKKTLMLLDQYSYILNSDPINSKVKSIILHRASPLITLTNGERYKNQKLTINQAYEKSDFEEFIQVNDSIKKYKNSDTIFVVRNGKMYMFILGKILR